MIKCDIVPRLGEAADLELIGTSAADLQVKFAPWPTAQASILDPEAVTSIGPAKWRIQQGSRTKGAEKSDRPV